MPMDTYSSRKYYCRIQMRAKYCQPSHPIQKKEFLSPARAAVEGR